jgi:tRNA(fMet)-specific endonuclease VapC
VTKFLLDTNHVGDAVRKVSVVRDRVQRMKKRGHQFATCGPVLCEVAVGFRGADGREDMRRRLDRFLKQLRIWPVDVSVIDDYADVYHELRAAGKAMSQVDKMVAALVRLHGAVLPTSDGDFRALPDIASENWLV